MSHASSDDLTPRVEWIPTREEMPRQDQECIVYVPRGTVHGAGLVLIATFQDVRGRGVFAECDGRGPIEGVTHWMELPDPPES